MLMKGMAAAYGANSKMGAERLMSQIGKRMKTAMSAYAAILLS